MRENKGKIEENNPHKNKVHKILAHSYLFLFVSFIFGLFVDSIFPLKFSSASHPIFGFILIILGTLIVFWAQRASIRLSKENMSKETFLRGPYRFSRSPTHLGIFLMMFGFGITTDSFFIIFFSIISILVAKLFFLKKQERILEEKYGEPYKEYKKQVKF